MADYIDKVQKIREEVARIQLYTQSEVLKQVLDYIDEVQKEEIPPKFPIISQKKCMYTKDHYTDEDRKVLCDGCEEGCEYAQKEEPVSELWHDSNKEQPKAESDVAIWDGESGEILTRCVKVNPNRKWAYMEDMLNKKEEPVSEELEEASKEWLRPQLDKSYANYGEAKMMELTHFDGYAMLDAIEFGAKWQKTNLWKPADGDDLPIFDRDVIALEGIIDPTATDCFCGYKVVFAHRPTPEGYDGKSIATGVVEHYTPKTYGDGGWNIPNVKYWLDVDLPKRED